MSLPNADVQGALIRPQEKRIVLSMSCTGCSTQSSILALARQAALRPLIIITPVTPEYIDKSILGHPEQVLVISDPERSITPNQFLDDLPQVAIIDSMGRVVEVPRPGETLANFVGRKH